MADGYLGLVELVPSGEIQFKIEEDFPRMKGQDLQDVETVSWQSKSRLAGTLAPPG